MTPSTAVLELVPNLIDEQPADIEVIRERFAAAHADPEAEVVALEAEHGVDVEVGVDRLGAEHRARRGRGLCLSSQVRRGRAARLGWRRNHHGVRRLGRSPAPGSAVRSPAKLGALALSAKHIAAMRIRDVEIMGEGERTTVGESVFMLSIGFSRPFWVAEPGSFVRDDFGHPKQACVYRVPGHEAAAPSRLRRCRGRGLCIEHHGDSSHLRARAPPPTASSNWCVSTSPRSISIAAGISSATCRSRTTACSIRRRPRTARWCARARAADGRHGGRGRDELDEPERVRRAGERARVHGAAAENLGRNSRRGSDARSDPRMRGVRLREAADARKQLGVGARTIRSAATARARRATRASMTTRRTVPAGSARRHASATPTRARSMRRRRQ